MNEIQIKLVLELKRMIEISGENPSPGTFVFIYDRGTHEAVSENGNPIREDVALFLSVVGDPIHCPVASTVFFDSPFSYSFLKDWAGKSGLVNKMYFVICRISDYKMEIFSNGDDTMNRVFMDRVAEIKEEIRKL